MELKPEMFKRFFPLPLTLITTLDKQGVANAAPYSCVMPVLRPLDLIALASALPRDTLRNIRETGEFVVNVIGRPSFRKAIRCAKNFPPEINELDALGIDSIPSRMVSPPRVKDAIGWIESKLEREVEGDKYVIIIGKVVCSEINDVYLESGEIVEPPIVVLLPTFRLLGEKVAKREEFLDDISSIKF